jgi:chemotaxis protein CheX
VRAEIVNAFLGAARSVLSTETGFPVGMGTPRVETGPIAARGIGVVVGVTGKLEGLAIYTLDKGTALKVLSAMTGDDLKELDELGMSGIAELGNVITGRAATTLAHAGWPFQISPPAIVNGNGPTRISTLSLRRLVVPLQGEFGTLEIHLAFREV